MEVRSLRSSVVSGLLGSTFRSLRHRNYRLFFWGQLISVIGTWLQNTALQWLVFSMTHDSRTLGIISFMGSVPVLLLSALTGTIADEYPKRRILIWTQSMAGVLAVILAIAIWTHLATIVIIAVLSLLLGVVNAFDLPTRQAFVVEMAGKEDLTNAVALNSAIFNSARLAGPAIAAVIIAQTDIPTCFLLNGLSYIAVVVGLLMMRFGPKQLQAVRRTSTRLDSMRGGVNFLWGVRQLRYLMILVVTMTVFGWSYSVNLPVVAGVLLKGDASTYATLLSANGLGALLAALSQARFAGKFNARLMVFLGIGIFISAVTTIAFVHVYWVVLLALVGTGFGIITFYITANSTLQQRVPDELRGRVMGLYSLSFAGLFPFGSLMAGFLAHEYGLRVAFLINGGVVFLVAMPVFLGLRKLPRLQGVLSAEAIVSSEAAAIEAERIAKA